MTIEGILIVLSLFYKANDPVEKIPVFIIEIET